jgi:regulator of protease activity HflC (stomatin/prohibitin superfamily)
MLYVAALAVVVVGITVAIALPFFLQWLAEEDILFTTVREGTVKAIVRGKSFDRFIMSFAGYHLNDPSKKWYSPGPDKPDWEVLYHGRENLDGFQEDDRFYDDRQWWLRHLGLHWVGWPWAYSVYVYGFEWNETITDEGGKEKILPRAEATDFIFVADFTYAIETDGAETEDRLPTDELTLVTIAIRNPYRALFSGEDWMRRVTAAINRLVRDFVGKKKFESLISSDLTAFSNDIVHLTDELPSDKPAPEPRGLKERYGVVIRTADLQTIELSGGAQEQHQKATTRKYVAEQEAVATRLEGQAKADVIEMMGEKEASALAKRLAIIKDHGEAGITLAGYDAIQEASKNPGSQIIWANNPLAPLAALLRSEKKSEEKKEGEKP